MTWDWHDIEKLSEEDKKKLQQEFVEAGKLPALPNLNSEVTIDEARTVLEQERKKIEDKKKNAEAGKNAPKMNLTELQAEQDKQGRKEIVDNLLQETAPKPPAKPKPTVGPKPPKLPTKTEVGLATQRKEIDGLLAPEAPNVPPVTPKEPEAPKPAKPSRTKKIMSRAKKIQNAAGTALGDAYVKYGKKGLKPTGTNRLTRNPDKHKNLKRLTMRKELSEDVKGHLKV